MISLSGAVGLIVYLLSILVIIGLLLSLVGGGGIGPIFRA